MESLKIAKTPKTPEVNLDYEKGELLIAGISIPENTFVFYSKVLKWLDEYIASPKPKTFVNLKLEYFNTSTASFLLTFFKKIQAIENSEVILNWYYESDDIEMEDVGIDYQKMLTIPVRLIPVETF